MLNKDKLLHSQCTTHELGVGYTITETVRGYEVKLSRCVEDILNSQKYVDDDLSIYPIEIRHMLMALVNYYDYSTNIALKNPAMSDDDIRAIVHRLWKEQGTNTNKYNIPFSVILSMDEYINR